MRENQTVFPHRRVGFAEPPAPIPGIGFTESYSRRRVADIEYKVAAEETSAAPATIANCLAGVRSGADDAVDQAGGQGHQRRQQP